MSRLLTLWLLFASVAVSRAEPPFESVLGKFTDEFPSCMADLPFGQVSTKPAVCGTVREENRTDHSTNEKLLLKMGHPLAIKKKPEPKVEKQPEEKPVVGAEGPVGDSASLAGPPAGGAAPSVSTPVVEQPGGSAGDHAVATVEEGRGTGSEVSVSHPVGCGADGGDHLTDRLSEGQLAGFSVFELWIKVVERGGRRTWTYSSAGEAGAVCRKMLTDAEGELSGEIVVAEQINGRWTRSRLAGTQLGSHRVRSVNAIYETIDTVSGPWFIRLACGEQREQFQRPYVAYVRPAPGEHVEMIGFQLMGDPSDPGSYTLERLRQRPTMLAGREQLCDGNPGCLTQVIPPAYVRPDDI